MKTLRHVCPIALILLCAGAAHATAIVDFEDWTGGSEGRVTLSSGGFTFDRLGSTPNGELFVAPDSTGGNPTLSLHTGPIAFFWMTKDDGGLFSISSFDAQEGFAAADTEYIVLTGMGPTGQFVAKEPFYLDGDPATYETFYPNGFAGLSTVLVSAGGGGRLMSIDNIVVPEPGALVLLLSLGVATLRRRALMTDRS